MTRVLASVLAFGIPLTAASDSTYREYQVKAAFLYNLSKFIEWPGDARREEPISFCILGDDPFGTALDRTVADKRVGGRPVRIRRSGRLDDLTGCEVLFVSASERPRLDRLLAKLAGSPVLTTADFEGFAERGGMIGFVVRDGRLGLVVNVDAAERAGLRVSSRLLKVAAVVGERRLPASGEEGP